MKKLTFPLFLLLFVFIMSSFSFAQVPTRISYQGVLKDASGTPLQGDYAMTFSIWASPEGGSSFLWEETYDNSTELVTVDKGLYSVLLGSINPFDLSLEPPIFNGTTRYLEVIVNGETMSQRIPIISVPYAFRAEQVGGFVAEDFVRFGTSSSQLTGQNYGLYATSDNSSGAGVRGEATQSGAYGVQGGNLSGIGVYGSAAGGTGVKGSGAINGVEGECTGTSGYAGYFEGGQGVYISGPITTNAQEYKDAATIDMEEIGNSSGAFFVNRTAGAIVFLPNASDDTIGRVFYIYNTNGGAPIVLSPKGGDTLIGDTSTSTFGGCLRVIGYKNNSWIANEL